MSVDLKKQASDLYKQRDDVKNIRTSETLSVNRIMYASLVIVVLALIGVQMFGGFSRRKDPIEQAMTPPQVVKEAPPPELLQEPATQSAPADPARSQPTEASPQVTAPPKQAEPVTAVASPATEPPAPAPPPVIAKPRPQPVAPAAPAADPAPARQAGPRLVREKQPVQAAAAKPAKRETVETKTPAPPPQPAISEAEQSRRQLARDIVLEKNPALLGLLVGPENKGWQADPANTDEYNVVFNIVDKATGTPVQYIWRVNLTNRTATPLSYYARKLS